MVRCVAFLMPFLFGSLRTTKLSTHLRSSFQFPVVTVRNLLTLDDDGNNNTDDNYMHLAAELAKKGLGRTFPNPAVGCVLVSNGKVLGSGFHPKAGFPHAEIFALLEAAGHVKSGVEAANMVVESKGNPDSHIMDLVKRYSEPGGPEDLFGDCLSKTPVTAYVTLEPCCHFGRTPPCASSLALAKANRVVVGLRDPNPRVDGGGFKVLEAAGVKVELANEKSVVSCKSLVENFCKRIIFQPEFYQAEMTGKKRSAMRSYASRKISEKKLPFIEWGGESLPVTSSMETDIMSMLLKPEWMEHVDSMLWTHELLQLKLSKAIAKRKGSTLLGTRVAQELKAEVIQSRGHTVLLYRPGMPPVLDFLQGAEMTEDVDEGGP